MSLESAWGEPTCTVLYRLAAAQDLGTGCSKYEFVRICRKAPARERVGLSHGAK